MIVLRILALLAMLFFLVVGLGSVGLLVVTGGKSDGPGAIFFYLGTCGGLSMAAVCFALWLSFRSASREL